ncbi:prostate-associated microseminoprotein-like [Argopecten irradians]|uniref:prostate-associated microseminoprotein-like n=1 Tax=Argopecten irradians TaxID=31199 RepID=UPI00370FAFD9
MINLLTFWVILTAGITLCKGQCYGGEGVPTKIGETPPLGCYWDGDFVAFNTNMKKNCTTCYCNAGGGLGCCVDALHIVQLPDECKIVPADNGCGDKAVKKDNEDDECIEGVAAVSKR